MVRLASGDGEEMIQDLRIDKEVRVLDQRDLDQKDQLEIAKKEDLDLLGRKEKEDLDQQVLLEKSLLERKMTQIRTTK